MWFAAVLGVTGLLAAATAWVRRRTHRDTAPVEPTNIRIGIGLACATVGAGIVGLLGPRTLPSAALAMATFVAGWWCLRSTSVFVRRGS